MNEYKEIINIEDLENVCDSIKKIYLYKNMTKEKYDIYLDTCYMNYHDLVFFCLRYKLEYNTHYLERESRNMKIDYHKYHVLDLDLYQYFINEKEDYFELFELEIKSFYKA